MLLFLSVPQQEGGEDPGTGEGREGEDRSQRGRGQGGTLET